MNLLQLVAISLGAILTNLLAHFGDLSAIVAAATVALVFAAIIAIGRFNSANQYLPFLYMGTFVGMSNLKSLPLPLALFSLIVASTGAFLLAQLLAKKLIGIGGKLGLIAFVAGVPVMLTQGLFSTTPAIAIDTDLMALMTALSAFVLMLSVSLRKQIASPVGISALISLFGALTPYPAIIMAASFAGMSADKNLSGWRLAAVAGVFTFLFCFAFRLIEGVGGWLGLLACASVYLVVAAERLTATVRSTLWGIEEAA